MANSSRIKLSYYENFYPDEGDFTLVYNLAESKQKLQNRLNANFWNEFRDILDNTIQNQEHKAEWHKLRVNGYCTLERCCCGSCFADCCCDWCCPGCFTMRCCRFCCCNEACDCCYGGCKSCMGYRDYFVGGVFLVVFGCLTFWSYLNPNPFGVLMLIVGAIMIENYKYNNVIKDEWRDTVISILVQDIGALANKYGVQFTMSKYGFFGIIIDMEITRQAQQQETVMLMVQQPQQTVAQPQQIAQVQPSAPNVYVPGHNQPPAPNAYIPGHNQPPVYEAVAQQGYEGGGTYQ